MVKFTLEPKDGMYLGRCFLLNDDIVGELWRQYRAHPRLMCNIQDDDFTIQYRFRKKKVAPGVAE